MQQRALGSSMLRRAPIPTALRSISLRIKSSCPRSRARFAVRRVRTAASPFTGDNSFCGKRRERGDSSTWDSSSIGSSASPGCILSSEASFLIGWAEMPPFAYQTSGGPRLCTWRGLALWLCVFSLLFALASRVPRFADDETSWVRSAPPHVTAKLLAKDFYLLQAPRSGILIPLRVVPLRDRVSEAWPPFSVFLDNRLHTRPPPISVNAFLAVVPSI